jgi:hypothetical protein
MRDLVSFVLGCMVTSGELFGCGSSDNIFAWINATT